MTAAILAVRPANAPDIVSPKDATRLVRLFALDRPPMGNQLVSRWHRDADGRLACLWEPDIAPVAER
jgi:hypothetical protein